MPVRLALPVEAGIDDDAFGHEFRAVALIEAQILIGMTDCIAVTGRIPFQLAGMAARIGVQQAACWD